MISTSKIIKIIVTIKKCKEKGIRADDLGSNPHSNGEDFSRSLLVFFDKINEIFITMKLTVKIAEDTINVIKITYIKIFKLFNWKLNILFILYKFN